jgi:predicted CXXCH cytochrome family protein
MADPDPPIAPRPDPNRARRAILVFASGLLLILAIAWWVGSPSSRTTIAARSDSVRASRADYLGSRVCSDCHPGEFATHSRSGHARTLQPAARTEVARRLDGATFNDPERPGATWSYRLRDAQLTTERREAGEVERLVIDYAFGSGHHATTFVTLTDRASDRPMLLEHRLTVFTHKDVPDITPGQDLATGPNRPGMMPSGRRYGTAMMLRCFECHTTVMSDRGPLALDEATMIPNVGCERCHGPGRAHVQAARRGAGEVALAMPFGVANATAADELRLCGTCHRLPEMGDRAVIRTDNDWLVRFQPVGLMQSACYRQSRGGLSCTSCHDPHARTSTDLAAYEAVCLSCHRGPSKTPCGVSPATGCIACHMPRRDASRGMMMTDHWIRPRPEAAAGAPPAVREHPIVDQSGAARAVGP